MDCRISKGSFINGQLERPSIAADVIGREGMVMEEEEEGLW